MRSVKSTSFRPYSRSPARGSTPSNAGRCRRRGATRETHRRRRSEEHTSDLQSLMRISYAVFCLKKTRLTSLQTYDDSMPYCVNTTLNMINDICTHNKIQSLTQ